MKKLVFMVIGVFLVCTEACYAGPDRSYDYQEPRRGRPGAGYDMDYDQPPDMFGGPQASAEAPDIVLKTMDGETVRISEYFGDKPIVLEFGSYTCPIFRSKHGKMEGLFRKYRDDAEFFMIYTIEAHPKQDLCPYSDREWVTDENRADGILYRQPVTEGDRHSVATKAVSGLDIRITMLVDDIENSAWYAYGKAPNAAYLIGKDGLIKLRQGWFEPVELEKALKEELAGAE